jgi:hypothetical protein
MRPVPKRHAGNLGSHHPYWMRRPHLKVIPTGGYELKSRGLTTAKTYQLEPVRVGSWYGAKNTQTSIFLRFRMGSTPALLE